MANVLQFDAIGGRHELVFRDVSVDSPGPGEVRFAVHAFALNQADLLFMKGSHYTVANLPARIGYEAAGVVEAVGPGVTRFQVGDRVTCIPNVTGPYLVAGEFALAHEDFLSPWPEGFTAVQASAFWMQYLTPYYPLMEIFPVKPGDAVLITAASSSASLGAAHIVKMQGGRAIGTTRSGAKRDFLIQAGYDAIIVTEQENLAERALELTAGRGVQLVDDGVGGPFVKQYIEALADDGRVFVHGALSGSMDVDFNLLPLVRKGGMILGYSLINQTRHRDRLLRGKSAIWRALEEGHLPPPTIDRVFPYYDAIEAYAYMESGHQKGKIVVSVSE